MCIPLILLLWDPFQFVSSSLQVADNFESVNYFFDLRLLFYNSSECVYTIFSKTFILKTVSRLVCKGPQQASFLTVHMLFKKLTAI